MNVKKSIQQLFCGWVPKESTLAAKLNVSSEEKKFPFNRRFYVSLAISYSLFVLLVVVPFLLGYIDSQIVGYGLVGIVYSLALMVMVRLLNDPPRVKKKSRLRGSWRLARSCRGRCRLHDTVWAPNHCIHRQFGAWRVDACGFAFCRRLDWLLDAKKKIQHPQLNGAGELNIKKQLSNRIRGWVPKEPNLPKSQMKAAAPAKIHPINIWNPLWIAPLCITLISFTINFFLFHIPLISAVIAVAIVDIAVILSIAQKQKNRLKIVDLGWVPKEPHIPNPSVTASPENKPISKNKIPKGEVPKIFMWSVMIFCNTSLSVNSFLKGDATGAFFLWLSSILGIYLALDVAVWRGKEFNPKLVAALVIAIINLGGAFATLYVFSAPTSFLIRVLSLGMLVVAQIPLLIAAIAYVWGRKDLSKKLMNGYSGRR